MKKIQHISHPVLQGLYLINSLALVLVLSFFASTGVSRIVLVEQPCRCIGITWQHPRRLIISVHPISIPHRSFFTSMTGSESGITWQYKTWCFIHCTLHAISQHTMASKQNTRDGVFVYSNQSMNSETRYTLSLKSIENMSKKFYNCLVHVWHPQNQETRYRPFISGTTQSSEQWRHAISLKIIFSKVTEYPRETLVPLDPLSCNRGSTRTSGPASRGC